MKKLVMATVFAISAIVVMGCNNKKEATHPSVISSVESSCSRKDDPVNNSGAQRGGGSKVVESKDETSLCVCGELPLNLWNRPFK